MTMESRDKVVSAGTEASAATPAAEKGVMPSVSSAAAGGVAASARIVGAADAEDGEAAS